MKSTCLPLLCLALLASAPLWAADLVYPTPGYPRNDELVGRVLPACGEGSGLLVLRCEPRIYLPPGRYYALEDQYLEMRRAKRRPYADFFRY